MTRVNKKKGRDNKSQLELKMPSKTSMKRKPEDVESEAEEDTFGASEPAIDDTVPAKRTVSSKKVKAFIAAIKSAKKHKSSKAEAGEDAKAIEKAQEPEAVYTCFQKVDTDRLQHINELILSPELEMSVRTLYMSVFFTKPESKKQQPKRDPDLLLTRAETVYYTSSKPGADPEGRISAPGLQNIKVR